MGKTVKKVGKEIGRPFKKIEKELTRLGDSTMGIFSPDVPKMSEIPDLPGVDHSSALSASDAERRRARAKGRGTTMLTGTTGSANVGTTKLLGG